MHKIKKKSHLLFVPKFLIFIGVLCCILSVVFLSRSSYVVLSYKETKGVIIDIQENGNMKIPIFKFNDEKDVTHIVKSKFSSTENTFSLKERILVLYSPTNPEKAYINSFTTLWVVGLFGLLFGLLFIFFSYCFLSIISGIPESVIKKGNAF